MALHTLSQFKSPLPKLPSPSPSPKQPNPFSSFLRFPSRLRRPAGAVALPPPPFSCSSGYGDYQHEKTAHSRPPEIPWSKDLANSVHLIGNIGASVQIKQLSSGKVLAWTSLGVKKSSSETSWINLTFWDELAHVAFQHVEKGNQVYVSGRLVSDTTEGEDDKPRVFYKVVVQQLSFIEKTIPSVSFYEQRTDSVNSGPKNENYASNSFASVSTVELWQAFFANPVDWWDNRKNKRNPKYPDFKHKDTGEALWIEGRSNPSWVKGQLAILDERMGSFQAFGFSVWDKHRRTAGKQMAGGGVCSVCTHRAMGNGGKQRDFNHGLPLSVSKALLLPSPEQNAKPNEALSCLALMCCVFPSDVG